MNRPEHIKELTELHKIALNHKDILLSLEILEMVIFVLKSNIR